MNFKFYFLMRCLSIGSDYEEFCIDELKTSVCYNFSSLNFTLKDWVNYFSYAQDYEL